MNHLYTDPLSPLSNSDYSYFGDKSSSMPDRLIRHPLATGEVERLHYSLIRGNNPCDGQKPGKILSKDNPSLSVDADGGHRHGQPICHTRCLGDAWMNGVGGRVPASRGLDSQSSFMDAASGSTLCMASPKSAYRHALARSLRPSDSRLDLQDTFTRSLFDCTLNFPTTSNKETDFLETYRRSLKTQVNYYNDLQYHRNIPMCAERILDAPGVVDDFYLHTMECLGSSLAVALGPSVYIWNAETGCVQELINLQDRESTRRATSTSCQTYVSSLSWMGRQEDKSEEMVSPCSPILAVGTSYGEVELWDVQAQKKLRTLDHDIATQAESFFSGVPNISTSLINPARIAAMSWRPLSSSSTAVSSVLSIGSRMGSIYHSDVRIGGRRHQIGKWTHAHSHEICGLAWSLDGEQLASGANDNVVKIWDGTHQPKPSLHYTEHKAAVKAMAWCPWQANTLATGGGSADRTIRVWNSKTGQTLHSANTPSQVTSLAWSPSYLRELISTHGYSDNQVTIWRYPSLTRLTELRGHKGRILNMCISGDQRNVITLGADENISFWNVFPPPRPTTTTYTTTSSNIIDATDTLKMKSNQSNYNSSSLLNMPSFDKARPSGPLPSSPSSFRSPVKKTTKYNAAVLSKSRGILSTPEYIKFGDKKTPMTSPQSPLQIARRRILV